jgi:hypothetical protein
MPSRSIRGERYLRSAFVQYAFNTLSRIRLATPAVKQAFLSAIADRLDTVPRTAFRFRAKRL